LISGAGALQCPQIAHVLHDAKHAVVAPLQFFMKIRHATFQLGSVQRELKVLDAQLQQFSVRERICCHLDMLPP
jgi:hypothetical protein